MDKVRIAGQIKVQAATITGTILQTGAISGALSQEGRLTGNLATAYSTSAQKYEGEYEVTPTVNGQTLETKQKLMTDDVTIHAIPFFEVGNNSGGNTVYIANELEMEVT